MLPTNMTYMTNVHWQYSGSFRLYLLLIKYPLLVYSITLSTLRSSLQFFIATSLRDVFELTYFWYLLYIWDANESVILDIFYYPSGYNCVLTFSSSFSQSILMTSTLKATAWNPTPQMVPHQNPANTININDGAPPKPCQYNQYEWWCPTKTLPIQSI